MKTQLENAARQLAASCLHVVSNLLYEWELRDAELEFYSLILAKLRKLAPERQWRRGNKVARGK